MVVPGTQNKMLPDAPKTRKLIREAAAAGVAIAELEYLGLSVRTINALESSVHNCVFLEDLIELSADQVAEIPSLGQHGLGEIIEALRRFPELESQRQRWHKGSDRLEFYKKRIPRQSYTLR